ncbi:histidine kinase [Dyadobacter luteus]|jgi:signal transduction histidine kinase|uniref:histidine kinase n=1 Tax=Dyadobacter luteus TaxID=2259619 RepID=A0A3D8Y7C5_9BACT|nr:histidine kinase [Dyadobacter luteus]REA58848.1 histidine kinase [Dyadobacter luteus]
MEKVDKRVAGSLTRFYVVALFVVAFLTLGGLFLIRKTISSLNYDGRVVNVAGRQRMISQRLTKLSLVKIQDIPYSDSVSFDSLLHVWKKSHVQLAEKRLEVGEETVVWKSVALDAMFAKLDPVFETMYQAFDKINNPQVVIEEKKEQLATVLKMEPLFLSKMNEIVFQYDKESFERLKNLERIEWIMDIMTILVLLAEGLLIFRPVVNETRRAVRKMYESQEALMRANDSLEEKNVQLVEAQEAILKIKEEKYHLRLQEDRIRTAAIIEGQEEERKRFARELHDGIGQMLTGLKLHAEKLRQVQFQDEKQRKRFDQLVSLIQDTIQTTRQISYNLMPSVLADFGLNSALKLLCEQTAESTGLQIRYQSKVSSLPLNSQIEIGLYRIAQEALNNAVKHAAADNITIILEENLNCVILQIQDDGKGFLICNLKSKQGSALSQNGIENMRTRAKLMSGDLEITSDPLKGTLLKISVCPE